MGGIGEATKKEVAKKEAVKKEAVKKEGGDFLIFSHNFQKALLLKEVLLNQLYLDKIWFSVCLKIFS